MNPPPAWLRPSWAFALPIAPSFPLGWLMLRSLDRPRDRTGKGLDALPMVLCRLLGRREPAQMDWKRYSIALRLQRRAVRRSRSRLLYAPAAAAAQSRPQGLARALGAYKDTAGHEHPGADTAVVFNTGLLVRDQHEPPALLGRAASFVFQPVGDASSG